MESELTLRLPENIIRFAARMTGQRVKSMAPGSSKGGTVTMDWQGLVDEMASSPYVRQGRQPWSPGYSAFKNAFIDRVLRDPALMRLFAEDDRLPPQWGPRLDERVVEYPWVFSRLRPAGAILDAGSTFNSKLILAQPAVQGRKLVIYTLEADYITLDPNISYVFDDLRDTPFKDALFDSVVCISTLEHIGFGLDYRRWSKDNPYPEARPDSYREALREFARLLKPGGQLLLTVPYGRREDHGWLQQFDAAGVESIKAAFGGRVAGEQYYRYTAEGWQVARPEDCADLTYYNIHAQPEFDADYAAAARAVVCLELVTADAPGANALRANGTA